MALNIVSEIINMVPAAALDKIASALGINGGMAKAAIAAAVPALLAAFGSKASTPSGARAVYDTVSSADPDVFGKLGSMLGGAKQGKFMEGGLGGLTSLLGDNALRSLTGAVSKQTGLSGDAGSSLMAIAGQLAMGGLAKQSQSTGLDASGLAGLLSSQQSNISSAMPAGLGSLLSSAGLMGGAFADQAGRTATNAGRMAGDAGRAATAGAHQAAAAAKGGSNWLMWLIPLVIVAAGLWYFLGRGTTPPAPTAEMAKPAEVTKPAAEEAKPAAPAAEEAKPAEAVTPAAAAMMVDGVDIGKQVTGALDGLKGAFGGITDAASATAALPKFTEATVAIDGVTGMLAKFSPEQKAGLAATITTALPGLKEMATKAMALPGVGDVLKPAVDGLMGKLDALAKPV